MNPERMRVWLGLVAVSVIWGSTWLAIRVGLESVPPFLGVGIRFLTASGILFIIVRVRNLRIPWDRNAKKLYLTLVVLSYSLPFGLVYWSQQHIPSGLGSILFAGFPFWVAVFSHALLVNERLTLLKTAGVVLGFVGLVIIFSKDVHWSSNDGLWGMCGILASTIMQALATVVVRKYGQPVNPFAMNCVGMFWGGVLLLLFGLTMESPAAIVWDGKAIGSILYLAVFGSIVAFVTYHWLLKRIEAVYLSLTSFINPIIAVLLGAVLLGETLPAPVYVGATCVLAGILVANGKALYERIGTKP